MEFLSRPDSPCKRHCPYREAFCKLDCEEYKEYEEKYKQYYEARQKKRQIEGDYIIYRKDLDTRFKKNQFRRRKK